MEIYRAPGTELELNETHKPIKGLLLSSLMGIFITIIVSMVFMFVSAYIFGVDLENEKQFDSMMYTNKIYMMGSIFLSSLVLFQSGRILGKSISINYNEYAAGLIVLVLGAFYGPDLIWVSDYNPPTWYAIVSFLSVPVAISLGVKQIEKHNK